MGALASAPIAVLCLLLEEYLGYLPTVDMTLLTAMSTIADFSTYNGNSP